MNQFTISTNNKDFDKLVTCAEIYRTTPGLNAYKYLENTYSWCLYAALSGCASPDTETAARQRLNEVLVLLPSLHGAAVTERRSLPGDLSFFLLDALADVNNKEIVDSLIDKDALLAWFCCDHSVHYLDDANENSAAKFRRILQTWTGLMIEDNVIPYPKFVVSLLHGPACWDLLGCTLKEDGMDKTEVVAECIKNIARLNLHLVFTAQNTIALPCLPDSLSN